VIDNYLRSGMRFVYVSTAIASATASEGGAP
jgi:hypothetical protein